LESTGEKDESTLNRHYDPCNVQWVPAASGVALCTGAAACLTPLFRASSFRPFLPLLFLGVVVLVAIRFGRLAGMLGTAAAALIFAEFLFEPRLSLIARDSAEKSNLIWMIIGGIVLSDFAGYRGTDRNNRRKL
jgi:K+-sensing histidine kinase KdpD